MATALTCSTNTKTHQTLLPITKELAKKSGTKLMVKSTTYLLELELPVLSLVFLKSLKSSTPTSLLSVSIPTDLTWLSPSLSTTSLVVTRSKVSATTLSLKSAIAVSSMAGSSLAMAPVSPCHADSSVKKVCSSVDPQEPPCTTPSSTSRSTTSEKTRPASSSAPTVLETT